MIGLYFKIFKNSVLKIIPTKYCKTVNVSVRNIGINKANVNTNVVKDVILFKYDKETHFKFMNLFALCQFGFWTYLSSFAYSNLRDAPVNKSEDINWWKKINLGDNKYRHGITIFLFIIGWGILSITWMYSLKSVKYLILRKGGEMVSVVTYSPLGKNRIFTLRLENISCQEQRIMAKSQLPLKIKGHMFYYILDMNGEFKNPLLFDNTAGLKRNLK
ncbi:unnamed protein product [Brassicogethes aeneus]|uniref:Transmembrane protein 223 n=1 Tax=Brassicogethes aeneus TaxID=1431903 RepID=A0A9P0ASP2_BRAAE|nr:unnamed protein product [Brassicogethes aeneus]